MVYHLLTMSISTADAGVGVGEETLQHNLATNTHLCLSCVKICSKQFDLYPIIS